MAFNKRGISIFLRLLIWCLAVLACSFIFFKTDYIISAVLLVVVVIALAVELFYFLTRENRQFSRFFDALLQSDFSHHLSTKNSVSNNDAWQKLANRLMHKVHNLQIEKHEKHLLLQLVTEHSGAGILVFDENGEIHLMNDEAKNILGINHLHNISAIEKLADGLHLKIKNIKPGENQLLKLVKEQSYLQIMVYARQFRQKKIKYTLLTLQHIGAELNTQEVQAWQKLTSVLSHEIMNSLTPVVSLAATGKNLLHNFNEKENITELKEVELALQTIEKRSHAMLNFVQAYRKINKLPVPELAPLNLKHFLEGAYMEFKQNLHQKNIRFTLASGENINVLADEALLQQVMQNLFANAIHALDGVEDAEITISVKDETSQSVLVLFSDNGAGVSAEIKDKLFVPFFSTKPNGSGIGLSVCKQIMQSHGGDIYLLPQQNEGATFVLRLRKA